MWIYAAFFGHVLPRAAHNAMSAIGVKRTLSVFLRSHPGFPTLYDCNTRRRSIPGENRRRTALGGQRQSLAISLSIEAMRHDLEKFEASLDLDAPKPET